MEYILTRERSHLYTPTPNLLLGVTIAASFSEAQYRTAIERAAAVHEILRCAITVKDNGEACYTVLDKPCCSFEVLHEDFDWNTVVAREEAHLFDTLHGELVRFLLYPGEDSAVLVLSAHHLAGDGTSLLLLARDIARCLTSAPASTVLSVRQPELSGIKPKLPFTVKMTIAMTNAQWKRQAHVFTQDEYHEMLTRYAARHRSAVCRRLLTPEETARLLGWCDDHALTPGSVVSSAFLNAADENSMTYQTSQRPEGYEGMGCFGSAVSVDHYPLPDDGFERKTAELNEKIRAKCSDPQKAQIQLGFLGNMEPTLIDSAYFAAFHTYANPVSQRVMTLFGLKASPKSLGVTNLTELAADVDLSGTPITDYTLIPTLTPNIKRAVSISLHDSRLSLTMHYPLVEAEEMLHVFEKAVAQLLRQGRTL